VEESREELIQISNGCICCIVRGDFIAAVERLLSSGKHIDYIIVEASGMSEPLPVAQSFLMNNFAGRIRLDGIICLVDALNFTTNVVQNTETASEQITFSDIIVLNKTDLVNEKQKNEILTFITTLNAKATIFESSYGKIDIRYLIDTHSFSLTEAVEEEMRHHTHHHDNGFSEFMYKSTLGFDIEKFENFIRNLPIEVFRIKGFCIFDGLPDVYLLQKV
jgi:G3E family GTPase